MCIKLLLVNVFLTTYLLICLFPIQRHSWPVNFLSGFFFLLLSCQQQKAVLYVLSLRVFAKVQKRQSLLDLSCFCYNAKTSVIIRSFSGELLIEPEARSFSTTPFQPNPNYQCYPMHLNFPMFSPYPVQMMFPPQMPFSFGNPFQPQQQHPLSCTLVIGHGLHEGCWFDFEEPSYRLQGYAAAELARTY